MKRLAGPGLRTDEVHTMNSKPKTGHFKSQCSGSDLQYTNPSHKSRRDRFRRADSPRSRNQSEEHTSFGASTSASASAIVIDSDRLLRYGLCTAYSKSDGSAVSPSVDSHCTFNAMHAYRVSPGITWIAD